jgi:hypothetical protein
VFTFEELSPSSFHAASFQEAIDDNVASPEHPNDVRDSLLLDE